MSTELILFLVFLTLTLGLLFFDGIGSVICGVFTIIFGSVLLIQLTEWLIR